MGLTTHGLGKEQLFSGEGTAYVAEPLRKEKGAKPEAQVVAGAWRGGKEWAGPGWGTQVLLRIGCLVFFPR